MKDTAREILRPAIEEKEQIESHYIHLHVREIPKKRG